MITKRVTSRYCFWEGSAIPGVSEMARNLVVGIDWEYTPSTGKLTARNVDFDSPVMWFRNPGAIYEQGASAAVNKIWGLM